MKTLIILGLILLRMNAYGQTDSITGCKYPVLLRDTIHISGVVRYRSGKPAQDVKISSMLWRFGVRTKTDSAGRFTLKNVRPRDTLFIGVPGAARVMINGSRFLILTVPDPAESPIKITATIEEKGTNKTPPVNMILCDSTRMNHTIFDGDNDLLPEYPGGMQKLISYIKTNLKYPQRSLKGNIEGEVVVQFLLRADGIPQDFEIVAASIPNAMKRLSRC